MLISPTVPSSMEPGDERRVRGVEWRIRSRWRKGNISSTVQYVDWFNG